MYGPVSVAEQQAIDTVAPAAPAFVGINQQGDEAWAIDIQLPTLDSDQTPLTGLTKLTVVTLTMVEGSNPFVGLSMDEIKGLPGVVVQDVTLTPEDAGTVKTVNLPVLNLGGFQAFAAACADDIA